MKEQTLGARTYEARYYRAFLFAGLFMLAMIVTGVMALAFLQGRPQVGLIGPLFYVALLVFSVYTQSLAPCHLTVDARGFQANTVFGKKWDVKWDRVRKIQLLWSRFNSNRIERVDISLVDGPKLNLGRMLGDFDALVAQLRLLHPELVEE